MRRGPLSATVTIAAHGPNSRIARPNWPHWLSMSKRILIIDGHPDPDRGRYCHALVEAYVEGARETGNEVRTLTLAEMNMPLLRTAQEFSTPPQESAIVGARADLLW